MLVLAATPIGNIGDASKRLKEALSEADLLVAEDSRVLKKLMVALHVTNPAKILVLNEHTEQKLLGHVWTAAANGFVLVVSDAGMPTINDPGFGLVRGAHERGILVSVVPGPSAGLTALAASGLPTDRFCHEGFVPRKGRVQYFESLRNEARTMIFFESPNRLARSLNDAILVFGDEREACVAREITKIYEEIVKGSLSELREYFSQPTKGEVVLIIAGERGKSASLNDALASVELLIESGLRRAEACQRVAKTTGLSRRTLYRASIANDQ